MFEVNMGSSHKTAWLVGGSGQLGEAIARAIVPSYHSVCLSRSAPKAPTLAASQWIGVDLAQPSALADLLDQRDRQQDPDAVVFCQRYRPNTDQADWVSAMQTEVMSSQHIIEYLLREHPAKRMSFVCISSMNATLIDEKIPFWYHLLKSSQLQLMRYFSVSKINPLANFNSVVAGTFTKYDEAVYTGPYLELLSKIRKRSPMGRPSTAAEVAGVVALLLSDAALILNGQQIGVDGGLANIYQEAV